MSRIKNGIPEPPAGAPGAPTMQALKEQAERDNGLRGNKLDRRPTVGDLLRWGLITPEQSRD